MRWVTRRFLTGFAMTLWVLVGEGTALEIETGLFMPVTPWSTAPKQSQGSVTVTRRTTGFKGSGKKNTKRCPKP